ncbi:bifunctional diaminohydroxyphosphoribosylaminopyrimidine deaminase/5-amino-6-(5-phosphoribosylamino)uracil reductase RibD [Sphingobacterium hungaricum]
MQDEHYMKRCFELAQLGSGTVSPNPMVGAVIVYEDKIIGEGYTSPYGGPHAEVNAIQDCSSKYGQSADELFTKSTLYVSLEPCSHFGKTPPCADLIIQKQFSKVVIGCIDPFAKVNGEGVKKIKDAGIEVMVGVLEKEAKWSNRRFFTKLEKSRPYVILKWAETADGYFAPEEQQQLWISNAASKQLVHKWRSEEDAILVGKNTAIADNPSLTVREWSGKNPKRILIDKHLDVPLTNSIYSEEAETIVFNDVKSEWTAKRKFIALENFDLYLPQTILYQLFLMDVQSIIIEGGAHTLQQFIDANLWDEARVIASKTILHKGKKSPKINGKITEILKISTDTLKIILPL